MPPQKNRATATGDLHNKFREDGSNSSRNMLTDRQTHTQTDRQTDRNTLLPYRGGVITDQLTNDIGHTADSMLCHNNVDNTINNSSYCSTITTECIDNTTAVNLQLLLQHSCGCSCFLCFIHL